MIDVMREVSAKIGGNQNDGDVPRLSHFAMLCQNLRLCLRSVERCVSENDPHLEYGISSLKQSSAFIGIIALAKTSRDQELAGETADVFDRSVRCFEQDKEIDPRLDYDAIASFRKLYAPLNKGMGSLRIGDTSISTQSIATIDRILDIQYTSTGTVTGRLEDVLTHGKKRFVIYPPVGNVEIRCIFSDDMLDTILASVEKNVTVNGTLHFAKNRAFPSHVDVDSIETNPDDSNLPSLMDLRGMLVGEEGGSGLGALRDEW